MLESGQDRTVPSGMRQELPVAFFPSFLPLTQGFLVPVLEPSCQKVLSSEKQSSEKSGSHPAPWW